MQLAAYTVNNKIATIDNSALNYFNGYPSSWKLEVRCNTYVSNGPVGETGRDIQFGLNPCPKSADNHAEHGYSVLLENVEKNYPTGPNIYDGVNSAGLQVPLSGYNLNCYLVNDNTADFGALYRAGAFQNHRYLLPEAIDVGIKQLNYANRTGTYSYSIDVYAFDSDKVITTAYTGTPYITGTAHPTYYMGSARWTGTYGIGTPTPFNTAHFDCIYPSAITGYGDSAGTPPYIIINP